MIMALEEDDFRRSLPHIERPGVWLDIYGPTIDGVRWYVKITLHEDRDRPLVLTCCRDGEAH